MARRVCGARGRDREPVGDPDGRRVGLDRHPLRCARACVERRRGRVHVDSFVAGELAQDGEAWVRTMGGTVGRVGQIVDGEPVFTVGRPSLVFLHRVAGDPTGVFLVTARAQGQFGLYADEQNRLRVRRSSAVGALVPPLGAGGIPPGALAGDVIHGRVVEDVTRDIATAWSRAHAP
jgi:hypothetical protein